MSLLNQMLAAMHEMAEAAEVRVRVRTGKTDSGVWVMATAPDRPKFAEDVEADPNGGMIQLKGAMQRFSLWLVPDERHKSPGVRFRPGRLSARAALRKKSISWPPLLEYHW